MTASDRNASRAAILSRLRAAPAVAVDEPDVAGWMAQHRTRLSLSARLERLRGHLEANKARWLEMPAANGWADLLALLAEKRLHRLLVGDGTPHGEALAAVLPEGWTLHRYRRPVEEWKSALFTDVDVAITRAQAAIAQTGSLVLWPTSAEPRLMSLVPPVHVVLLDAQDVVNDWDELLRQRGWSKGMPTNAVLVSGPSKTADIQQTLAYGAHGPKELIVCVRMPVALESTS